MKGKTEGKKKGADGGEKEGREERRKKIIRVHFRNFPPGLS